MELRDNRYKILERSMTSSENRKGCLMAKITDTHSSIIISWGKKYIPDSILYIKDGDYGRELETHATVLYGFNPDLTDKDVNKIIENTPCFKIKIEGMDIFRKDEYDVIILKVSSDELSNLNKISKTYPNENDYPDYKPHITLAYVKPGEGEKYKNKKAEIDASVLCDKIVYSSSNKEKTVYPLQPGNVNEAAMIDTPPPIVRHSIDSNSDFSPDFLDFIKNLEASDPHSAGFDKVKKKWYPINSAEGGRQTIAYGHKVKNDQEEREFSKGITEQEAVKLLVKDLMVAKKEVHSYIRNKYKVTLQLSKRQEEMLVEYAFNLGSLSKFPRFTDAVLRNQWDLAKNLYKRSYRTASGERKSLTRRNTLFFNRYFK